MRRIPSSTGRLMASIWILWMLSALPLDAADAFISGDSNADGAVDVADPIHMLGYAFSGGDAPPCLRAADPNGDESAAEISDAVYLLLYEFSGGMEPVGPFPSCGEPDAESSLPCDSFEPCSRYIPFDVIVEGETLPSALEPAMTLTTAPARAGDPVEFAVSDLDGPAVVQWGDGETGVIDGSGSVSHVFPYAGEYPVTLESSDGIPIAETLSVEVHPSIEVVSVEVVDLGELGDLGGAGAGRPPVLPPGFFCQYPVPPLWAPLGSPCLQFPHLAPGPQRALVVDSTGLGHVTLEVILIDGQGQEIELGAAQLEAGPEPAVLPLPPLPTNVPGLTKLLILVRNDRGELEGFTPGFAYETILAAGDGDPCDELRLLHTILTGRLRICKASCDGLRDALAKAQKDLADAETALADAQQQLADAEAERDALHDRTMQARADVEAWLGDAGSVGTPAEAGDRNFVGAHGIGVAFADAGALLQRSDEVEAATGTSLLAMVNDLAQLQRALDAATQRATSAAARVAGAEQAVTAASDRVADLEAQLAECEAKVEMLESDLEAIEEAEDECLAFLAEKRRLEDEAREIEEDINETGREIEDAASDADDADDAIGGSQGSDEQKDEDRAAVSQGESELDAAGEDLDGARSKLAEAKAAIAAGDHERAEELLADARECQELAAQHLEAADDLIDDAVANAEARECTDGDSYALPRREFTVWDRILGYTLTPGGTEPGEWEGIVNRAQDQVDALVTFIKFINELGDSSPIAGTFTPNAEEAVQVIFDAFAALIARRTGLDVWVLLEGHVAWTQTVCECVGNKWTHRETSGRNEGTVRGAQRIGWLTGTNETADQRELERLMEMHGQSFAASRGR